jgi:hypothetical protein
VRIVPILPGMGLFLPQAGLTKVLGAVSNRRAAGRLHQEAVTCTVGTVVNLSAGGMQVVCCWVPRGEFPTTIRGLGMELEVLCRVAWTRRRGLLKREVGLEFVDVADDVARKLSQLAMTNRMKTVMYAK